MKIWNKIKDAPLAVAVYATTALMAGKQAMAQTADVLNPIQQVEDARVAAQNTTLDVDSAKSGAEKIADVAIVWAAPIGLLIALFGFYLLHKANQDESGRTGKGMALATIAIGGCTCVFSVLTFVFVEYVVGTKT
ncbi:hypothetical protein [Pontitalea aquivivens]|uniref:hypothetical protein n=1 Tax=Pontitalea aquivivens TaxID=3388663 RepID=UPI003970932E